MVELQLPLRQTTRQADRQSVPLDLLGPDEVSRLLATHTDVLEQVAAGAPLPALLDGVTRALERLIPRSRCSILLLSHDGRTLRHGAAPNLPADYSHAIDGLAVGPTAGSCGTAAHEGAAVVAEDITLDARWVDFRALAVPHGLRSCWSTPIRGAAGQVVGTFAVYHDEPHRPSGRELQLVDRFTYLAAVAIEHAALYGELAVSEERFRRAFEDNAVGMALLDLDGIVTRANPAMSGLVGPDTVLDRPFVDVLDEGSVSSWRDAWSALTSARTSGPAATESRSVEVDLDIGPTVLVTMSVVRDHDGRRRAVSLNALDVTERRAAAEERRARREAEIARRTAESASRAKSEFLTGFSHELRTPLQAITGFTELFATLDLDDVRRSEALGHVRGATAHLLAMVEDVLDISRIEAGRLPMDLDEVRLARLARDVVELLGPLAAKRSVTLDATDPALRVSVRADARRLRQVLINLVTNAVRYGAEGGTACVTLGPSDDPGQVVVLVRDDGPGIPPELMDRVFVPFDTLDVEPSGEGVGVGLIVAQGLCEAMGGSLRLTSAPGEGTTARITLPTYDSRDDQSG